MLSKPHWTDGLELGPAHFELLDRYHAAFVDHRLAALHDFAWGIHEIRWDTRAIGTGQVSLLKLDAILPDGTIAACDAAQGQPGPAVVLPELRPGTAIHVFLGVRQLRAGGNVDLGDAREPLRYRREKVLVPDVTGGSEPAQIEGLRPNVHLLLEGQARQDFVTMPCARVMRSATGQLAYDDSFVPSVLSVSAAPLLHQELRAALDAVMGRQGSANGTRLSPEDATEAVRRWIATIVGSFVPRIADLTHQRFVHPHTAYGVVSELVGALAPFTAAGAVRIPPFEYDRIGPVFSELFAGLRVVLDAIGAEHYKRIPLVRHDPTTLFADLKEPAIFRNDFLLSVSGSDLEDLRLRVPQLFKVGAWSQLPEIVRTATSGVPLQHEPRPPGALPGNGATLYFRLQKSDAFSMVMKHGQMGIFHGQGLPITEMALFAVEPGGGVSLSAERIDREIAAIDGEVGAIVDAVLHDPKLQALEAAWRGLAYVVERVDPTENTEVVLWSYSKEELVEDIGDEPDATRTRFFRHVYTAEYGQHGGKPYGVIFANWDTAPTPEDVNLLRGLASVAAMAHAPLLLAASPALLRLHSLSELQAMTHPEGAFEGPGSEPWASFRRTEDSRYVGVLLPRVLLRLPHEGTASRFVHDERALGAADFLWGSPIFAFAVRVAGSFARYRSLAGIVGAEEDAPPLFASHSALGPWHIKPPVEVVLSRRLEQSLSDLGLIPLSWDPVRAMLRFSTANSAQLPKTFGSGEGGDAATLSHLLGTRLPHLFLASRFAHYLKVLEREHLGGHREKAEIERDLNTWIANYVVVMDNAPPETRLKHPLRNARVTVSDVPGMPGIHRMDVKLQPHLRYMRQAVTLQVDGRLEAR